MTLGCGGLSRVYAQFCWALEGRCTSSLLQGHPPSLRFGHPDVATDGTDTSARTTPTTKQQTKRATALPAPHAKHQPSRNTLKGDSPPPPQFARHGAHTKPPQTFHHPNTEPPRNTLNRDSPPPPQFARHGAHILSHHATQRTGGIPRTPEPQMRRGIDISPSRHQGVRSEARTGSL